MSNEPTFNPRPAERQPGDTGGTPAGQGGAGAISGHSPDALVAKRQQAPIRPAVIVLILVLVGAICAVGWFADDLSLFFRLQLWNPGAPAGVVTDFLQAGKDGNEAKASQDVTSDLKPLVKNGKLVGFFNHDPHFNRDTNYLFSDLEPQQQAAPQPTVQFVKRGEGAALVTVPTGPGHARIYRLVMDGGRWKIEAIV